MVARLLVCRGAWGRLPWGGGNPQDPTHYGHNPQQRQVVVVGCGALHIVLGHYGQLGGHAVVEVEEDGDDEARDQGPRYPLALQLPHVLQRQPMPQAGGGVKG